MSLINEALQRARVEAARRDAAEKGVPPAALPVYVPPRRRPWLAPVAGFAAGLVAVGMAAGAFWFVRQPAPPEPRSVLATAAPEKAPVSPVEAVPGVDPAPTAAASRTVAVTPPASTRPAPAEPEPVDRRPPRSAAAPPAAPEARPSAQWEAPPPSAPPPLAAPRPPDGGVGGQTFLRQAAPAGGSVRVDFIVWSESRPFAQINGQLIGAGQSVDGYTLLKVERERVELEGGGERFWIRVRP